MELKLNAARYDYYELLSQNPMACETMREHIVPDSCADIAQIVDTSAQVYVTSRELGADGRLCASGTVDVSVLYIPEKGTGPCALRFQLPFQCCSDGQLDAGAQFPDLRAQVQNVDTRLLNPRKVLTRVNLVLYPTLCRRVSRSLCTDAMECDDIQLLPCRRRTRYVAAVREKEFTYTEEISLSQGRGGAEEILSCRAEVCSTDCKLIGTKLVLKGIVAVTALYRDSSGILELTKNELPFSQILDGSELREDWEFESVYRLLNLDCRIGCENGADDRHVLTLSLHLRARVTVWRSEEIRFIADLYSTKASVVCKTEEFQLREDCRKYAKRINMRETLETGAAVRSVLDTEIRCGGVRLDSASQMLEIPVWARCLYLDENDMLQSVSREFTAKCPSEEADGVQIEGCASCRSDVMASILPDGIELRFPLECALEVNCLNTHICVSGGEIEEEQMQTAAPSLVLRRIGSEERLWSVAKAYRTTCKAILEINEIEDEHHIPSDKLLLIPQCR